MLLFISKLDGLAVILFEILKNFTTLSKNRSFLSKSYLYMSIIFFENQGVIAYF